MPKSSPLILPTASDIAEHASAPSRGRQVPTPQLSNRYISVINFAQGEGDAHRERHLDMLGPIIPTPTGFNIHVLLFQPPEKTAKGLVIPEKSRNEDRYQGKVGLVIAMGPDAYKDPVKFPSGPWCKLHDWIIYQAYLDSGRKFTWIGENAPVDILVMYDDKVDGVIIDPVLLR